MKMYTLSFGIIDYLSFGRDYPVHITLDNFDRNTIEAGIKQLVNPFVKHNKRTKHLDWNDHEKYDVKEGEAVDPTGRYFCDFTLQELYGITNCLVEEGYYVVNRYEKYYVIAFSINYTRFEVFSKDCDKEIIKWREEDQEDPIKGIIKNNNYNENPVITLLKQLNQ